MPHLPNRAESRRRVAAMRADRARGWTYRQIAAVHRCDVALAWRAARDVDIVTGLSKWHLARLRKPEPAGPVLWQVHAIRGGLW